MENKNDNKEKKDSLYKAIVNNIDTTWQQRLLERIKASKKQPSDIYTKAHISKQTFSKIKNEKYRSLDKKTALAFAIGLELELREAVEFLAETGHAFSDLDPVDVIVRDFIYKKKFSVTDINIELSALDLPLLGEERNGRKNNAAD